MNRVWSLWRVAGLCLGALGLSLGCSASVDSGQTGSPIGDPPQYQSPDRYSPTTPGGGVTNPGPSAPDNNPTYRRNSGDFSARRGRHLVTLTPGRGLDVFDVTDPLAPELVGQLSVPLRFAYQLLVDEEGATIAGIEQVQFSSTSIPSEEPSPEVSRLIRVDLTDPTNPVRVADTIITGTFWEFTQSGNDFTVLTQHYPEVAPQCDGGGTILLPVGEGGGETTLLAQSFTLDGGEFTETGRVELPGDGYAFLKGDWLFTVNHSLALTQKLHAARFRGEGAGTTSQTFDINGVTMGLDAQGSLVTVLASTLEGSTLLIYDTDTLTQVAELPLPAGGVLPKLLGAGNTLLLDGPNAQLIDLTEPSAPSLLTTFAEQWETLLPVGPHLLGFGSASGQPGRELALSLWDLTDPSSPTELASLETGLSYWSPASNGIGAGNPGGAWRIDTETNTLALPMFESDPSAARPILALVDLAEDNLVLASQQLLEQPAWSPVRVEEGVYSLQGTQLESALVTPPESALEEPATSVLPLFEPRLLHEITAGNVTARLTRDEEDHSFLTFLSDGAVVQAFELDHLATELALVGDAVVAMGLRWHDECDFDAEASPNPVNGKDLCAPYLRRGISVFSAEGEPALVTTLRIESDLDITVPEDASVNTTWSGYTPLSDSVLAFAVDRRIHCHSEAACDALDITASESQGTMGGASMCDAEGNCDPTPPQPEVVVSGWRQEQWLYRLDLSSLESVSWSAPVLAGGLFNLPGEGPLSIERWTLTNGDSVGYARTESVYDSAGASVSDAFGDSLRRFYLERLRIDDSDGALTALPSVNTPGEVVAWRGDYVYSVEPKRADDGARSSVLHRSQVANGGAFIEDTLDLESLFYDSLVVGDYAWLLLGPDNLCTDERLVRVVSVALNTDALDVAEALTLPGLWGFELGQPELADDVAVLRGGRDYSGQLRLDLQDASEPQVLEYLTRHVVYSPY